MSTRAIYRLVLAVVFLLACALLIPRPAHAQSVTCSANASNVNFGTIDPSQSGNSSASGQVSFTCHNHSWYTVYVTACLNIGAGNSSSGNTAPRDMDGSGPPPLNFQLYKDAAHTQIWGSVLTPATPSPRQVQFTINRFGTYNRPNYTRYGQVPGGQTGVSVGTYQNGFSGVNAALSGLASGFNYPASCGNTPAIPFPFNVRATVQPACTVSASNMNFGTAGLLDSAAHDDTAMVSQQ